MAHSWRFAASGSPAARAGLEAGDVLVQFQDTVVDTLYDFTDALRRHKPGEVVTLVVERAGARRAVRVTLGRRP